MKKQNKLFHVLVFMGVSTLVLVLLFFLIGKNIFRFSESVKADFRAKQEKLQETQTLVGSVPNPAKTSEDIDRKSAFLKEMSYNKKQVPKLIQALVKAAEDEGVTVLSVRPRDDLQAGRRAEGVTGVALDLELRCEYRKLAGFLDAIAALPYSFAVESLSMIKRDGADGAGQLDVALMVSTYLLNEY
ncbi:MAG: type 4a pilus biogenesis protein PilO [Deltaproteobacteria bacterium]